MTTSFENLSHKQMIAWLDQANSAAVQTVADRLASAATAINKIGEELKVRPQMVEWKGQGAESFRTWSADLANATLRLGLYSEGASKNLSEAAGAIALAKAAIPRPQGDPEASIEAARQVRNDPDAVALVRKLNEEREMAAAEMRKLSQTYSQSVNGFGDLKKPEFPPPPQVIAPEDTGGRASNDYIAGGGGAGATAGGVHGSVSAPVGDHEAVSVPTTSPSSHARVTMPVGSAVQPPVGSVVTPPVAMEIDSVVTLPTAPPEPVAVPPVTAGNSKPDGPLITPNVLPPSTGGRPALPTTTVGGKAISTTRSPLLPGTGNSGVNPIGRPTRDGGIVGGRPAAQTSGRPPGSLPRGTVIGGEGTHAGRAPMGRGGGVGGVGGGGQSGIVGGRRLAGQTGGVVGGRPQQPGRTTGRPFTPGGTGLVGGRGSGDGSRAAGPMGRGGAASPQRAGDPRRDDSQRPDYLVEDEETWQQGSRRVVPPVID